MGLVTRAYDFVNGTVADGDQVDTELNTLFTLVNGNIDNQNIKPAAGIDGSKLASGSVGTTQLADLSVDNNKLKYDAAVDGNRAVTTNHIRDGAVTQPKIPQDAIQATHLKWTDTAIFTMSVPAATFGPTVYGFAGHIFDTGINRVSFPIAIPIIDTTSSTTDSLLIQATLLNDGTANWKLKVGAINATAGILSAVVRVRYVSGVIHT